MKINFLITLGYYLFLGGILNAQDVSRVTEKTTFSIGETLRFHSDILKEERTINVYLPLYYSPDSLRQYPVIYLLDGSADEDFIHIAGLVQFGSFPWINQIPETIVVGIANTDRQRDFTFPTSVAKDKEKYPTTGGSKAFMDFIEKELQPFIGNTYRIDTVSTLIGQSLGGLLATEILLKRPHMFDNYIIVSPSLWWDNESLLQHAPEPFLSDKSVYIAVGNEEQMMIDGANALYQKLASGDTTHVQLFDQYFQQLDHGDILHLAVYDGFNNLFRNSGK